MSSVALIYVGAVLVINGMLLLGRLSAREAGPLNLFVGAIQVFTPTYLILTADGAPQEIFAASGIYLFGFTYLWVGINCMKDYSNRGFGWFALLVALCTAVYSLDNFLVTGDAGFGVVWALWGILWFCFYLVLGLDRAAFGPAAGAFTVVIGIVTAVVAFMNLLQVWSGDWIQAGVIAVVGVLALVAAKPLAHLLTAEPHQEVVDQSGAAT